MPDYEIPEAGLDIWTWFFEILSGFRSVVDGVPVPIPWTEFLAWQTLTGNVVSPDEYAILRRMSAAWCEAMGAEIADQRARDAPATKTTRKGKS